MLLSQMVSFSLSFGPSVSLGCLLILYFLKALLDPNFFPIFVGHSSQTMLLWFFVVCCLNILLFLKVFPHIKQEYLIGSLKHSVEFMVGYQEQGFTIGELSETAQEAINAPTKKDISLFSFRGSHSAQNLGCFIRNWMTSDPSVLEYAE